MVRYPHPRTDQPGAPRDAKLHQPQTPSVADLTRCTPNTARKNILAGVPLRLYIACGEDGFGSAVAFQGISALFSVCCSSPLVGRSIGPWEGFRQRNVLMSRDPQLVRTIDFCRKPEIVSFCVRLLSSLQCLGSPSDGGLGIACPSSPCGIAERCSYYSRDNYSVASEYKKPVFLIFDTRVNFADFEECLRLGLQSLLLAPRRPATWAHPSNGAPEKHSQNCLLQLCGGFSEGPHPHL